METVANVRVPRPYVLEVTFSDGLTRVVNVEPEYLAPCSSRFATPLSLPSPRLTGSLALSSGPMEPT